MRSGDAGRRPAGSLVMESANDLREPGPPGHSPLVQSALITFLTDFIMWPARFDVIDPHDRYHVCRARHHGTRVQCAHELVGGRRSATPKTPTRSDGAHSVDVVMAPVPTASLSHPCHRGAERQLSSDAGLAPDAGWHVPEVSASPPPFRLLNATRRCRSIAAHALATRADDRNVCGARRGGFSNSSCRTWKSAG